MQLTNTPGKLVLPFANAGAKNTIPTASQIGITAGAASLTDGFPPLTRTPIAAGGVPPSGLDMNGILYELSAILRWANAGGGYAYDAAFATDSNVGGYPKGARIMRSDGLGYWFNTVENNTTDPEAAGAAAAGWVPDFTNGVTSVAMASANVTLTPLQYGKPIIVITGTLTANLNLIFPAIVNEWTVINNTSGPYTITCKTASGTGLVVNTAALIVGDGTNIQSAVTDAAALLGANVASAGGTANALTFTLPSTVRSWAQIAGIPFWVRAASANSTTPTAAVNGLNAKIIVKGSNSPLVAGDIAGAGHWLMLQYDAALDKVVLQNPAFGIYGSRIRLTSPLTLYVSPTGSDANNGLTAGSPLQTIQKAWSVLALNYELNGFTATIQLENGTYTAGLAAAGLILGQAGPAGVVLQGNTATPSNAVISTTASDCISVAGAQIRVRGVKFQTTSGGNAISVVSQGVCYFDSVDFGAMGGSGFHVLAASGGSAQALGNYTISGGAYVHWNAGTNGSVTAQGVTVALTGTPAFSYAFAAATALGVIYAPTDTFTGAATGVRYQVHLNSVIFTGGAGAAYLPGNAAGSSGTGGQYA